MQSSETANLPAWEGQDGFYEIWFFAIFDTFSERAYWLRYSTFSPAPGRHEDRRVMLWAAAFDPNREPRVVAAKADLEEDDYDGGDRKNFHVRFGAADVGHGYCRGEVESDEHHFKWEVHFAPAERETHRLPHRFRVIPTPIQVRHANAEIELDGWINVDGDLIELRGAIGTQVHMYGSRRVDELTWMYRPPTENTGAVELLAVTPHKSILSVPLPTMSSLHVTGDDPLDAHAIGDGIAYRRIGPTCAEATWKSGGRSVRVRAFGETSDFIGLEARDPLGDTRFIAHSDIASVWMEEIRPHAGGARLHRTLVTPRGAALEFHDATAIAGVVTIDWSEQDASEPPAPAAPPSLPRIAFDGQGQRYERVPLPPLARFFAVDRGEFEAATGGVWSRGSDRRSSLRVRHVGPAAPARDASSIRLPSSDELLAALDGLRPGLRARVMALTTELPAMMTMRTSVGLCVLEREARAQPRFGFFLVAECCAMGIVYAAANEVDAISLRRVAGSFPGFLCTAGSALVPLGREEPPSVQLSLDVGTTRRFRCSLAPSGVDAPTLLAEVEARTRRQLGPGDCVMLGDLLMPPSARWVEATRPVPRLRRRSSFAKERLLAAIAAYPTADDFVLPGDELRMAGDQLGEIRVRITA